MRSSANIEDVFASVEAGDSLFGVVPVENSTEGAVNNTQDCLLTTSTLIVGEIIIPIVHNLLGREGLADEIMLISSKGTMVRTRVDEVSVQGRNTQGVRLIRLKEGEKLVGLERVDEPAEEFVEELNSAQSENDENNAD